MVAWWWLIVAFFCGLFSAGIPLIAINEKLLREWPINHSADDDDVTSQYDSTEG